ncbi:MULTISPECIES: LxmA leader domain family RiPP [Streptomyces]|uniref:LxmA leader domain family RiPP n=1 Tax=Streptomyces TaxID=1883 RepID=UPI00225016E2|nr:LxmA leader domain family RiPP [Streptomyces sp. NBC_01381]MCX4665997.1 LxmA leader domain family RiPP [Streptomyces sp. NBC_01381]
MNTADQLISGYTAYTDSAEIGAASSADAPAITPTTSVTVVSVESILASAGGAASFSAGFTLAKGC